MHAKQMWSPRNRIVSKMLIPLLGFQWILFGAAPSSTLQSRKHNSGDLHKYSARLSLGCQLGLTLNSSPLCLICILRLFVTLNWDTCEAFLDYLIWAQYRFQLLISDCTHWVFFCLDTQGTGLLFWLCLVLIRRDEAERFLLLVLFALG